MSGERTPGRRRPARWYAGPTTHTVGQPASTVKPEFRPDRSAHRRDTLRLDLVDDADLSGAPVGVAILPQILLGQGVDVLIGPLLGHLDHATPDGQVAVRIVRIQDRERDFRGAP